MNTILAIALGGALGALARHSVNVSALKIFGDSYPHGTLGVNVLGSFAMGALISVFAHYWQPTPEMRLFLITGFLGAFTTFSAFSLDFATLYERGAMGPAFFYVGASVVLSIGALLIGMSLVRSLVA